MKASRALRAWVVSNRVRRFLRPLHIRRQGSGQLLSREIHEPSVSGAATVDLAGYLALRTFRIPPPTSPSNIHRRQHLAHIDVNLPRRCPPARALRLPERFTLPNGRLRRQILIEPRMGGRGSQRAGCRVQVACSYRNSATCRRRMAYTYVYGAG